MSADDVEAELLALAGQLRDLETRVSQLDGPIEQINELVADLVAQKDAVTVTVFFWPDLDIGEAQDRWTDLLAWIRDVLVPRCPLIARDLHPCWWRHLDAVDAITAAWLTWVAAYRNPAGEPTDLADWQRTYRPALHAQLRESLGSCRAEHTDQVVNHDPLSDVPTVL